MWLNNKGSRFSKLHSAILLTTSAHCHTHVLMQSLSLARWKWVQTNLSYSRSFRSCYGTLFTSSWRPHRCRTSRSDALLIFASPQMNCPYVGAVFFISTQTGIVEPEFNYQLPTELTWGSTYVGRCFEVTTVSQLSLSLCLY